LASKNTNPLASLAWWIFFSSHWPFYIFDELVSDLVSENTDLLTNGFGECLEKLIHMFMQEPTLSPQASLADQSKAAPSGSRHLTPARSRSPTFPKVSSVCPANLLVGWQFCQSGGYFSAVRRMEIGLA
jgi:hypothetical protein